ncbi:redoxin family protein [Kytococcus sedentarius]|uniref:redoxin family protein n=1 Tax=Kytococcus sedentarius TaxID=1276 RepID=UPI0035BC1831
MVINVWGSWCGPCIEEAPALEQVASDLREAGEPVRFIGVNSRDSVPSALAFQQAHGISYPSLQDDGGRTRAQLGGLAVATPSTIVLDGQGRVAARISGQVDASTLRGLVDDIVDQAERLRPAALELLRDRYDRDDIALILIGMPGLEKQFSHYPQFYSRVGFAHQYRPLGQDELLFVLERHWRSLGKTLDPDDFTDAQAIAAISRITRGNFRLLERLFPQIQRVLKINELDTITNDVIEAAQSTLLIGVT